MDFQGGHEVTKIFHHTVDIIDAWMLSKRTHYKVIQWCYLVHVPQDQLYQNCKAATAAFHTEYSLAMGH